MELPQVPWNGDGSSRQAEGRWDEAADPQLDVVAYTAPPRERAQGRTRRGPAMEYVGIDLHKKESSSTGHLDGRHPESARCPLPISEAAD
jgi:hypothetical protein